MRDVPGIKELARGRRAATRAGLWEVDTAALELRQLLVAAARAFFFHVDAHGVASVVAAGRGAYRRTSRGAGATLGAAAIRLGHHRPVARARWASSAWHTPVPSAAAVV